MAQQMENKYFTPDIEDFHVGYEYEYEDIIPSGSSDYFKGVITKPSEIENLFQGFETGMRVRVPYLTKEQIEAEGWEQDERYNDEKHFYKNNIYLRLYIGYHYNKIIAYTISIFNEDGILFKGNCKDINTFRKICKLLEI